MIEGTIPDIQTSNKDRIQQLYIELNYLSSVLLNQVNSNAPGNVYFTFIEFRQGMYELYSSSYRYKNFNNELKRRYLHWKNIKTNTRPSNKFIYKSIKLYNDIIDELVRVEVLEL